MSTSIPAVSTTSPEDTLATLTGQVHALVAENAALRERLTAAAVTPPAVSVSTPAAPAPAAPSPVSSPAPSPVPAMQWGLVANGGDPAAGVAAALPRLAADGGAWLRLWHSNFGLIPAAIVAMIDAAVAAKVRVILCVQPKDTEPKSFGTPDFAGFVSRNAATLKKLAFVEAGNELNLTQYRPDDLGGTGDWHASYVQRWLKPLSAALAGIGVKTLCTSITDTYHPENYAPQYAALHAAGAADCCDGVAIHAYFLPQSLQTLSNVLTGLQTTWQKPMFVTECNVSTKGLTPAQWQERFPPYLATLRTAGVTAAMFYRGFAKADGKWTWPVLFDPAGKPTDAYGLVRASMATTAG